MRKIYLFIVLALVFFPVMFVRGATGDITIPLCSTSVHDSYHRVGPDGSTYKTWHQQIDPSGCRFDHEHGSNPALFLAGNDWESSSFGPAYGYSATKYGMTEGHAGFKGYALRTTDGTRWYIVNHFGTANAQLAACTRFHTVDVAVASAGGTLLADVHLMADFGPSVDNQGQSNLTPSNCPNQGTDASGSNGIRQIPVTDHGDIGYEPWRMDRRDLLFGFNSGGLVFNTPDAQTACNTLNCTSNNSRTDGSGPAIGTFRFLVFNNDGLHIWSTQTYSGTFYTDPTGTASRTSTASDAVKQYIAPGSDLTFPADSCEPYDAQAYWYDCSEASHDESQFRTNVLVTGSN